MATVDPKIFKTYDIRGVVPKEINAEVMKKVARALVEYLRPKLIVVGYDARKDSKKFAMVVCDKLATHGIQVVQIGMVPTEVFNFACVRYSSCAGMMITASHNPKEYNGIKIVGCDIDPITAISGLDKIKKIVLADKKEAYSAKKKGKITSKNVWPDYLKKVLSLVDTEEIKPMSIVCDALNGVAGIAVEKVAKKLPIQIEKINFEPNGNFPNNSPDPLDKINHSKIIQCMKNDDDYSMAVIFDGDGDRIIFVDEKSQYINTDHIAALITKILLIKCSGESIVFDIRRGWSVKEQAEGLGSKYFSSLSGYPFIRKKMQTYGAIFGGESSGHYLYRDFYYSDSSIITLLLILEYISKNNLSLSEAINEYREAYFMKKEMNFKIKNVEKVYSKLCETFSDGNIDRDDDLSISYVDWHFNLHPSATEPVERLNIEGTSKILVKTKQERIIKIIKKHGGTIVK